MTHVFYRQRNKISKEEWEAISKLTENAVILPIHTSEIKIEPDRGPALWGYVRCSHQDSIDSGLGLEAQRRLISRWAEFIQEEHPDLTEIRWIEEEKAVSAYKVKLMDRPGGKKLHRSLHEGDHVVFAYLDRIWRNTEDCLTTLRLWTQRGIIVHFANLHIDTNSVQGKLLLTVLAACAEMDSGMKSERIKEVFRGLKAAGRSCNGKAPFGYKLTGVKGQRRALAPDPKARRIMGEIVRVRDTYDWTWQKISDYVEKWLSEKLGRPFTQPWKKRFWSLGRCTRAYNAELELRAKASKPTATEVVETDSVPPA
jgi:DNA invertase Pin-like site-specific DNA recombinase